MGKVLVIYRQPNVEYELAPDNYKAVNWLRKKLRETGGYIYFSSGEAEPELYSQLEDDFKWAKEQNDATIYVVAGPVMRIPYVLGLKKRQKGREYLNPVVRLTREDKIQLYPADKRLSHTFMIFSDVKAANIEEPYAPGKKPKASKYIYNQWIEYAPFETLFSLATLWKSPVTNDFTDHFLFLTDGEIRELRKWATKKGKDVMKIDLKTCKEF